MYGWQIPEGWMERCDVFIIALHEAGEQLRPNLVEVRTAHLVGEDMHILQILEFELNMTTVVHWISFHCSRLFVCMEMQVFRRVQHTVFHLDTAQCARSVS